MMIPDTSICFEHIPKLDAYQYLCYRNSLRLLVSSYGYDGILYCNHCLGIADNNFLETGKFKIALYELKPLVQQYSSNIIYPSNIDSFSWQSINDLLRQNIPVIIVVDVYYIPYKTYYHISHGSHCIILNGIEGDRYHVIDWYYPDYIMVWLERSVLERARISRNIENLYEVFTENDINGEWFYLKNNFCDLSPQDSLKEVLRITALALKGSSPSTGLEFIENMKNMTEESVGKWNESFYSNLLKSFFYFEIERKIHLFYVQYIFNMISYQEEAYISLLKTSLAHISSIKMNILKAMKSKTPCKKEKWITLIDILLYHSFEIIKLSLKIIDHIMNDTGKIPNSGISV